MQSFCMIVWSIAALHPADAMNLARAAGTAELTLSIEAVELTLAVEAASCVQSQISPAADAAELARAEPDLACGACTRGEGRAPAPSRRGSSVPRLAERRRHRSSPPS